MKETEDDIPRKRKKIDPSETNGKPDHNTKNDMEVDKANSAMSIYQRVTAYEEREALTRDKDADMKMFTNTCSDFSRHINEIAELKLKKPEGLKEKVLEKKVDVALMTITLKKLNRIEKIRNKLSRDNVIKVRQQVDVLQLQLQNLQCEIQRLKQEVDKCLLFKSKPLGIDLVPVEEFYENAPKNISRPDITRKDDHQLQLARLEWELQQRKELSLLSSQLEDKKNVLSKLIEKKINDLDSLAPLIKDVLNVTKPMQDKLGLPSSRLSLRDDLTSLLPHALYFLFVQSFAYSEACDKRISVDIVGDKDKAKLMKSIGISVDNDSSTGESEAEELTKSQKKEKKEKQELKRKTLLSKHPLSVVLKMTFKGGTSISLEFSYLINLKIMTVLPTVVFPSKVKSSAANLLLQNSNILTNLFPGDDGVMSPNVANHYQLQDVGLDNFDHKKIGLPYLWVQRVGGLDFEGSGSSEGKIEPTKEISKLNIPLVMKEISKRIKSRVALVNQVMELEHGNVIGPTDVKLKLSCVLKNWEMYSWEEYKKQPATHQLQEAGYVSPSDLFFKGVITREQAILTVFVSVKCNYPATPPVYALQLQLNNNTWNSSNNSDIIDIEREINVYWKELTNETGLTQSLLTLQIFRTMVCLDIMLECSNPEQFGADKKMFFHPARGRNRARPYKYERIGEGVFLQR